MATELILPSNQIVLGAGGVKVGAVDADPASVAQAGNPGDLLISSSTKKLYVKQDGGTSTSWSIPGMSSLSGDITATAAGVATIAPQGLSGSYIKRMAVATYNFATLGGAQGDISLGVTIPSGAIITRTYLDIITGVTSAGSATVAIKSEGAADLLVVTAKASLGAGLYEGKADGTVANMVKCTAARALTVTVGTADLTAGKFYLFVEYVQSSAT